MKLIILLMEYYDISCKSFLQELAEWKSEDPKLSLLINDPEFFLSSNRNLGRWVLLLSQNLSSRKSNLISHLLWILIFYHYNEGIILIDLSSG